MTFRIASKKTMINNLFEKLHKNWKDMNNFWINAKYEYEVRGNAQWLEFLDWRS